MPVFIFSYDMNFSYTPILVYTTQCLVVAQNVRTKAQRWMLGAAERIKKNYQTQRKIWKQEGRTWADTNFGFFSNAGNPAAVNGKE